MERSGKEWEGMKWWWEPKSPPPGKEHAQMVNYLKI